MSDNFSRGMMFGLPQASLVAANSVILNFGTGESESEVTSGERGLGIRVKGSLAQILHATVTAGVAAANGALNIEHSSDGVVWERCTHVRLLVDGSASAGGEGEAVGEIVAEGETAYDLWLLVEEHTGDDYLRGTVGIDLLGEFDGDVALDVIRIGGTPFDAVQPDYSDLDPTS